MRWPAHTADHAPPKHRCLFFVTPAIVRLVGSAWPLRQCGVLRLSARRAFGRLRVNTCGSEGLPLPGGCTHNITLPSLPACLPPPARWGPNSRKCSVWGGVAFPTSSFHPLLGAVHLELIRAQDFSENGTGNALSDSRSHTLNGNLNKRHPHRRSACKSRLEFMYRWAVETAYFHSRSLSRCGT